MKTGLKIVLWVLGGFVGLILSLLLAFWLGELTELDGAYLWVAALVVVIVVAFVRGVNKAVKREEKEARQIYNPDFGGHKSSHNVPITLCSADYPEPSGQAWILSENGITIVNRESNKTVLLSAVQATGLNFGSENGVLELKRIAENQFSGGVNLEYQAIATIIFAMQDKDIAQAIHDRVAERG
ncbi:MAG: hypothetical protein FWG68_00315 [Defluviitaleaceae bacterium]|nr:hypothetical protein [Defluviitaleaceae bacterium]